jgi:hypothetical protein
MVYPSENYMAHIDQDEETTRMPWDDEDGFFVGRNQEFIEGYRVLPKG